MKTNRGYTVMGLLFVVIWVAGAIGWIWNIVKIVDVVNGPITLLLVMRCIGVVVAPLGAVLGFL